MFKIIDIATKKEVSSDTINKIAKEYGLLGSDINQFCISEDGHIVLMDDTGKSAYIDTEKYHLTPMFDRELPVSNRQCDDIEDDNIPCDSIEDELEYKNMCIEALKRDNALYMSMLKQYEEELEKHMSKEDYTAFATKVAKITFFAETLASQNEEFRNMVLENWEDITKEV